MATDVRTVEKLSQNLMFDRYNPYTELCQFLAAWEKVEPFQMNSSVNLLDWNV